MKCLSIRQPWAHLICAGKKDVENRTWKTRHRGTIFVHAAKEIDMAAKKRFLIFHQDLKVPVCSVVGGIVGRVDIVDCVRNYPSKWATPGHWNWILENPILFMEPIPFKGRLGLFEVPEEDLKNEPELSETPPISLPGLSEAHNPLAYNGLRNHERVQE